MKRRFLRDSKGHLEVGKGVCWEESAILSFSCVKLKLGFGLALDNKNLLMEWLLF
jgi:hypothetical protein